MKRRCCCVEAERAGPTWRLRGCGSGSLELCFIPAASPDSPKNGNLEVYYAGARHNIGTPFRRCTRPQSPTCLPPNESRAAPIPGRPTGPQDGRPPRIWRARASLRAWRGSTGSRRPSSRPSPPGPANRPRSRSRTTCSSGRYGTPWRRRTFPRSRSSCWRDCRRWRGWSAPVLRGVIV